jgi:pimeloyl-ACP methyl ester carboxylesterase
MPYNRLGHGPRPLIVFQGLLLENKPQPRLAFGMYQFLEDDYTVYSVLRKRGMPRGYTLKDMADDYAAMIREEFGGQLDVIGISTGGSIVQHFAADHPDRVRRLVIHSSAYVLSDTAKQLQLTLGQLAQRRQWRKVWALLMSAVLPQRGIKKILTRPIIWLFAPLMAFTAPKDPTDLIITVEAEDQHNFKDRLPEITAPTLVVAGEQDPFYTPTLFRETAAGIPHARLCLYPNMGHPAGGKQFKQDVLAFLRAGN